MSRARNLAAAVLAIAGLTLAAAPAATAEPQARWHCHTLTTTIDGHTYRFGRIYVCGRPHSLIPLPSHGPVTR